jgi:uncharacterized membrane protein
MTITVVLFVLVFPALTMYMKEKIPLIAKWSTLIVCYAAGLIVGNLGILPAGAPTLLDTISTIAVAFSIPLLLYSVDIRRWKELSGKSILAFVLAAVSVIVVSTIVHFAYGAGKPESWKVAGMLVGLYTGGTPNLAAIKEALHTDMNVYLAVHTSDIVLSALYLLAVMTIAKPIFSRFLPVKNWAGPSATIEGTGESPTFSVLFSGKTMRKLPAALGLTVLVVGVSLGVSLVVPQNFQTAVVILLITSLALALSLVPSIRAIPKTFAAGEYMLYVFCVAVGAMGNFSLLINNAPTYFIYVAMVIFGSFFLHAILCAIFKIDVDTMLVVSTSAICSPPFVGVVAVSINARKLIVPGITTGIIGYAVGNYLGIALAQVLHAVTG